MISRECISRGLRDRVAERVTIELGPRSEQEIRSGLEREVESVRWTSLDRALRDISDESGGVADLRPGAVAAASLMAALTVTGVPLTQQRIALVGAGSAGCGILALLLQVMIEKV